MRIARVALVPLFVSCTSMLLAQTAVSAGKPAANNVTEPLLVDVHAAPYRPSINVTVNISRQRVDIRNATIVNLIDIAHGIEDDDGREDASIAGGPSWIDFDRFDLSAVIPSLKPTTREAAGYGMFPHGPYDDIRPIVERILEERFRLKWHNEDRPLPGYVVTAGKDGPKLAEAKDPTAAGSCQGASEKDNPGRVTITCTSETIGQYLTLIGGTSRHPLLDHTGLTKPYDFTLRFSSEQLSTREDTIRAYIEEMNKQLGIVMTAGDVPQPAIVVDGVQRTPTQNPPQIAKLVPPMPELVAEVASIRPAAQDDPAARMQSGGSQITLSNFSLEQMVVEAWQLPTGAMLANVPPWLDHVRYTVLVKLPPGFDGRTLVLHQDPLDGMLKELLTDRFQMKAHWGEQVEEGWVLLPGSPKMKKADPASRTYCKYGPAEGEKDVRRADSPFNGMFHCQNVTMAQFADLLQGVARSEIKTRVTDKTGLAGSYDFSLYFTGGSKLHAEMLAAQAAAKQAGDATAGPVEGMAIDDAVKKELGVRLEQQPLPLQVLILDHVEEKPTEN